MPTTVTARRPSKSSGVAPEKVFVGIVGDGDREVRLLAHDVSRLLVESGKNEATGVIVDVSEAFLGSSARALLSHLAKNLAAHGGMLYMVVGDDADTIADMFSQFQSVSFFNALASAREKANGDTEAA